MENVRLPLLKKSFFLENVNKEATMREDARCIRLLWEAGSNIMDPTSITPSKRTSPRPSYQEINTDNESDTINSNSKPGSILQSKNQSILAIGGTSVGTSPKIMTYCIVTRCYL